jgi:hypothetical protein
MVIKEHADHVNPVYPSDTDDLEWRVPAPEDVEYPYSAEDPDDDMYINI